MLTHVLMHLSFQLQCTEIFNFRKEKSSSKCQEICNVNFVKKNSNDQNYVQAVGFSFIYFLCNKNPHYNINKVANEFFFGSEGNHMTVIHKGHQRSFSHS